MRETLRGTTAAKRLPTQRKATSMLTPQRKEALGALWGKAEATLSNGAYGRPSVHYPGRTNTVHERNLSQHSCYKGSKDGTMAMGIVEALLAALIGNVRTVSC